jgi:hypothetical protein
MIRSKRGDFSRHLIQSSEVSVSSESHKSLGRWFSAWRQFGCFNLELPAQQMRQQRAAASGESAGFDEEGLLAAVAEAARGVVGLAFREEAEVNGDWLAVEKLAGEGSHLRLLNLG